MKQTQNKNQGFTLIELLIVIAIVGLLASIVLASLSTARIQAEQTQAFQDAQTLSNALEMYYTDHGTYPVSTGSCTNQIALFSWQSCSWNILATALNPYLTRMPYGDPNINLAFQYIGPLSVPEFFNDSGNKCFITNTGYLIVTIAGSNLLVNSNSTVPQNDGGISPSLYEIYGGNFYHGTYHSNAPTLAQTCQ